MVASLLALAKSIYYHFKKLSAGIAILERVSHFILFDTRVSIYNALLMPYFYYCSAVWVISIRD